MNTATVIANLERTIAGKEKMLAELHPNNPYTAMFMEEGEAMARRATIEFLKININELKRILIDVKQLSPEWTPHNCPYAEREQCHRMD